MDGPDLRQGLGLCLTHTWLSASQRSGAPAPSVHAGLTLTSGVHMYKEQPHVPALCCRTP